MKAKLGIFMIVSILVGFTLGGCFNIRGGNILQHGLRYMRGSDTLVRESEEKTFKTIRSAVEKKDSDAIYELFSKTAKDSGITKESIDELIEVLHQNLGNWKKFGLHSSEENEYGVRKIVYDIAYAITIDSEPYVLVLEECVRDDKNEDNIGIMRLTLFFYNIDLGMPKEKVDEYGAFFFTKEEVDSFKDEILKQREEYWEKIEAEEAVQEAAYEKEMAEKIKVEEEKEKQEKEKEKKEKAKKEKEKKKKHSIRKTVGKKWKSLKKKFD